MAAWRDRQKSTAFRGRRIEKRMRRRRVLRKFFFLFLCAGLVALAWFGTRLQSLTITDVVVSGGITIDHAKVRAAAQSALDGSYLFLIPKRFAYLYPHNAVATAARRVSRVADVTIVRTSRTSLSVTITEHIPYALWCERTDDASEHNQCLFVTKEGWAFAPAPSLRGATLLRYATEGRKPQGQTMLASADYMQATRIFAAALAERHGMYVAAIIETTDGDVRYRLRGNGELLVDKDADMEAVFGNLDAILGSKEFAHIKSSGFNYIDLRFGNKVFVKEFPDKPQEATSTDAIVR